MTSRSATLVDALNAAAGAGTLGLRPVAGRGCLPTRREQDVIRTGFIYQPAGRARSASPTCSSDDGRAFANAREPLAQAFKAGGRGDADAFAVIVNHFKSKGSGTADDPNGQGNANDRPDRRRPTAW